MRVLNLLASVFFIFLGIILIFLTVYLFGWELLEAPFVGNEMAFVISMAEWVDKYLFQGVQWYPFHGGGISVTQATQIGVYYPISFLHRLTELTISQATRIVSFLTIFLVSLEIFFLVWWRFKSKIMALLAAFFFPLSQAVWTEVSYLGVLALPYAVLFILPTIFLFDFYLREKKTKVLVLTIFSFALAFLSHLILVEMVTAILFFWALVFPFVFSPQDKWSSLKFNLMAWFKTIFLGILLISFWLFPFLHYIGIVGRNLIPFQLISQVHYVTLPFILGFGDAWGGASEPMVFFALPILIFAFLGVILALVKKDKLALLLGFLSVVFLIYPSLPYFAPWFVEHFFMNVIAQSYERAFVIPSVILPILASYGVFQVGKLFFFWTKGKTNTLLTSLVAILLSIFGLVFIRHIPPANVVFSPCYFGFGPSISPDKDYCQFWGKIQDIKLSLGEDKLAQEESIQYILGKTEITSKNRLDISPWQGSLVMVWPLYSQSSILNIQLNPASLNKIFWGYQVGAFYGKHEFGAPNEVANLASWFGTQYLILNDADPLEKYTPDYWQEIGYQKGIIIKKFKGLAGMVTLSSKPKILVLGKFVNRGYEQFFRLASAGAYPYGRAMFVEGKDSGAIDDYTLGELKKFEMILLYGYTYKDQKKAFNLLENYVKDGGRLFIDTGWQYVSPDWQMEQTPDFFPVQSLKWQEFKSWDLKDFSPPEYKGGGWGVSASKGLKTWAEPVLESGGNILVAQGDYGQGKIVWSGMNLIGHAFTYRDVEEFLFFENLIDWLISDFGGEDKTNLVDFQRINPDKIEFSFSQPQENVWLYWRENFYPDWQARLSTGEKLKIYRAGPNFMLLSLKKVEQGDKVVLELRDSALFIFSRILSVVIFIFLLTLFFKEDWVKAIKQKIKITGSRILTSKTKSWWDREEEN